MTRHPQLLAVVCAAALATLSSVPAHAQPGPKFLAPADQNVAIRAGRMFDSRSGTMLNNQVILIRGDKIADVGPGLAIPAGARVIDLSNATVMPGMIDAHVHVVSDQGAGLSASGRALLALANAQTDLDVGFTTVLDMDSRGGVQHGRSARRDQCGSRDGAAHAGGRSVDQPARHQLLPRPGIRTLQRQISSKTRMSTRRGSPARPCARRNCAGWIGSRSTPRRISSARCACGIATRNSSARPSLTFEEVEAIVDESHRLGLKVACHAYAGEGMTSCINAGVDAPNHLLGLDDAGVRVLLEKRLPLVATLDDLIALEEEDMHATANRNSRMKMMEQAFRKALARRHPDRLRQRRHLDAHSARQAGRSIPYLCEMGDDARPGAADGLSSRSAHAELRLGERHRLDREGQVRRHHRGLRQSAPGHHRDGTRPLRDEGRRDRPQRSPAPMPNIVSSSNPVR